jgi:putative component of toxin-antitoxin plasmid stabilization module
MPTQPGALSVAFAAWRWEIPAIRSVGQGIQEMRIDYGPGYRIYHVNRGGRVVSPLVWRRQAKATAGHQTGAEVETL